MHAEALLGFPGWGFWELKREFLESAPDLGNHLRGRRPFFGSLTILEAKKEEHTESLGGGSKKGSGEIQRRGRPLISIINDSHTRNLHEQKTSEMGQAVLEIKTFARDNKHSADKILLLRPSNENVVAHTSATWLCDEHGGNRKKPCKLLQESMVWIMYNKVEILTDSIEATFEPHVLTGQSKALEMRSYVVGGFLLIQEEKGLKKCSLSNVELPSHILKFRERTSPYIGGGGLKEVLLVQCETSFPSPQNLEGGHLLILDEEGLNKCSLSNVGLLSHLPKI
ncbi:hypothetical protein VNO77_23243 [Canavalia gladiata]|uniref:Uncharacterized protein n=1 Tax=Canavalia gladiata TaxID=3824 RepID=A0AAN9L472_CANGL